MVLFVFLFYSSLFIIIAEVPPMLTASRSLLICLFLTLPFSFFLPPSTYRHFADFHSLPAVFLTIYLTTLSLAVTLFTGFLSVPCSIFSLLTLHRCRNSPARHRIQWLSFTCDLLLHQVILCSGWICDFRSVTHLILIL